MNTTAIRNVTKVTSLRGARVEGPEKSGAGPSTGPGCLARAVALHLAGQREEALKQLQRAVATNEGCGSLIGSPWADKGWRTSQPPESRP